MPPYFTLNNYDMYCQHFIRIINYNRQYNYGKHMPKKYIGLNEFDINTAVSTGGHTGSKKVTRNNGIAYQLKSSIKDARVDRRLKDGNTDQANFGELIAATISRSIAKHAQQDKTELVPEISFVYDASGKRVLVASKYFKNVVGTLDDFGMNQRKAQVSGKHVKVSAEVDIAGNLNLGARSSTSSSSDTQIDDENSILRRDLAVGLALSVLAGDHDVNPSNMLVVKDKQGKNRIARIDFGHAFNDLLNAPQMFGGKVRNKNNQVLDFLNREEVANFPAAGKTKLWRDYQGIVPSQELVDALNILGKSEGLQKGVIDSKESFQELINDLLKDPKANKDVLKHIKNSLITINNNISSDKILPRTGLQKTLDITFKNIEKFYQENQKQMLDVAKLMDIQLKIDKVIIAKKEGREVDPALQKEIQETYEQLVKTTGIGLGTDKGIEWVRTSQNIPGFKGTIGEFIERRALMLGVATQGKVKNIDDFVSNHTITDNITRDIINESALVANFLDHSVKCYIKRKQEQDRGSLTAEQFKQVVVQDLHNGWFNRNESNYTSNKEIVANLKENLSDFVDAMDKQLTEARDKVLKDQGVKVNRADERELREAMQQVSTDNIYTRMSKEIIAKGHLKDITGDTVWKSIANLCTSIGLKKLGEFFGKKNEATKLQIISNNIGKISSTITSVLGKEKWQTKAKPAVIKPFERGI